MSSENQSNQMQQYLAKHAEGFAAFSQIYADKNPPPSKPDEKGADWITIGALGVLVLASVIVSGSRTIVEFGGGIIGGAAFIMLELAMIAYAYWNAKRDDAVASVERSKASRAGMWIAFGVSMIANVHATLGASYQLPEWIGIAIGLALAISAPTLALIAGDMLGREAVALLLERTVQQTYYEQQMRQWETDRNDAWDRQKSRWGVRLEMVNPNTADTPDTTRLPLPAPANAPIENSTPVEFSRNSRTLHETVHETVHEPREGRKRIDIRETAKTVYANGDGGLSTEDMMSKYGISQGSTSKIREYIAAMNGAVQPQIEGS